MHVCICRIQCVNTLNEIGCQEEMMKSEETFMLEEHQLRYNSFDHTWHATNLLLSNDGSKSRQLFSCKHFILMIYTYRKLQQSIIKRYGFGETVFELVVAWTNWWLFLDLYQSRNSLKHINDWFWRTSLTSISFGWELNNQNVRRSIQIDIYR